MKANRRVGGSDITPAIDHATCRDMIPSYVQQELANNPVEQLFPTVAMHIETCPDCEAAYYREFRQQGLLKSVAELQQVGHPSDVLAKLLSPVAVNSTSVLVAPGWLETTWQSGRAWLDQASITWRQFEIVFSKLVSQESLGSQDTVPAWVLAGLQGGDEELQGRWQKQMGDSFTVVVMESKLEVHCELSTDRLAPEQCRLDIAVTLHDRFGDYSGVEITLLYADVAKVATTDALGKSHFDGIPRSQLQALRLIVRLPE
jgi:hypothetical protein